MTAVDRPVARRRRRPSGWHLVLIPTALIMAAPLLWMLVTSLSTLAETRHFPPRLPSSLHWHNFVQAWTESPFGRWLLNSLIVSVTCLISNLVLCSLAGYAFARLRFPGSKLVFVAILATLMVPFQVVMIPTLLIVKHLHLVDTLPALIAPNLVTPFGIYLLRQFFLTLPVELEEAALIDGATLWQAFVKVALPLSRPGIVVSAILSFIFSWNNFVFGVVLAGRETRTLPVAVYNSLSYEQVSWGPLAASAILVTLPVLVLTLFVQREIVGGLAAGAVKGG
jgi:multiple sugar transport system permease protein